MLTSELPPSACIIRSADTEGIARALRIVLEDSLFAGYGNMARIIGESFSGRVLSPRPFMDTVKFQRVLSPTEMARELVHAGRQEARYDPPFNEGMERGWEIRKAMTDDDHPIAVVWAVWVSAPLPQMPTFF